MRIFMRIAFTSLTILLIKLVDVHGQNDGSYGSACTSNDNCNSTGNLECVGNTCQCQPRYTVNRLDTCRLTYGEACEQDIYCNIDKKLGCLPFNETTTEKICQCQKSAEQIFDNGTRKACVSRIGFGCDHDSGEFNLQCVEGAFCDMPIVDGHMTHECKCNPGWDTTEDLKCVYRQNEGSHGSPCTSNDNCSTTEHLECVGGTCQCQPRYTVNANGICKLTYGETCESNDFCNIDKQLDCLPFNETTTEKVCQCKKPIEQDFDNTKNSCVSLVGFYCDHATGEFNLNCIDGAFCDMPIVDGQMIHECKCSPGWDTTQDLKCVANNNPSATPSCGNLTILLAQIMLCIWASFIH